MRDLAHRVDRVHDSRVHVARRRDDGDGRSACRQVLVQEALEHTEIRLTPRVDGNHAQRPPPEAEDATGAKHDVVHLGRRVDARRDEALETVESRVEPTAFAGVLASSREAEEVRERAAARERAFEVIRQANEACEPAEREHFEEVSGARPPALRGHESPGQLGDRGHSRRHRRDPAREAGGSNPEAVRDDDRAQRLENGLAPCAGLGQGLVERRAPERSPRGRVGAFEAREGLEPGKKPCE